MNRGLALELKFPEISDQTLESATPPTLNLSRLQAIEEHFEDNPIDFTLAALGELDPPCGDKAMFRIASLFECTEASLKNQDALAALHGMFRRLIANPDNTLEEIMMIFQDRDFKSWKELGMILAETNYPILESMKDQKPQISRGRIRAVLKFVSESSERNSHTFQSIELIPKDRANPHGFNRIPDIYYDNPTVFEPKSLKETAGLFSEKDIIPCEELLKGHALASFCTGDAFSANDLEALVAHPLLASLNIVSAPSGTFPAAFPFDLTHISPHQLENLYSTELEGGSYEGNTWFRDDAVTVSALLSQGNLWTAAKCLRSKFHHLGAPTHRANIIRFHLDPQNAPHLYENGCAPPIKAGITPSGPLIDLDHTWDHRQGDALGSVIALGYELMAMGAYKPEDEFGGVDIHQFDSSYLGNTSKDEHILRAVLKAMCYYEAPYRFNTGPWEDKPEASRATCVGATLWATRAALAFHRRHGFHQLGVSGDWYGDLADYQNRNFEQQLLWLSQSSRDILSQRIPDKEGAFAHESDGRPLDAAVILLLSMYRLPLTRNQEDAILRTWFANMGEVAVRRWVSDLDATAQGLPGDDPYMGKNYHSKSEHPPHFQYFSDNNQKGDRSPEWPAILSWGVLQ